MDHDPPERPVVAQSGDEVETRPVSMTRYGGRSRQSGHRMPSPPSSITSKNTMRSHAESMLAPPLVVPGRFALARGGEYKLAPSR